MSTIYQLLITLKDVKPKVWRRIQVDPNLKLSDFHNVLQTTMGWTNSHLHQFEKNGKFYSKRTLDNDLWEPGVDVDYTGLRIKDFLEKEKDSLVYVYDFGDSWKHVIELEKLLTPDFILNKPVCLGGARSCPQEDAGGADGYNEMQLILLNSKHPEYKDYKTWAGDDFDPTRFDATEVTELLRKKHHSMFQVR